MEVGGISKRPGVEDILGPISFYSVKPARDAVDRCAFIDNCRIAPCVNEVGVIKKLGIKLTALITRPLVEF